MERTLYLNDSGSSISVMRDGPSLWIEEKGGAGRRIPVRFIDLVILVQNVKIDAQSLAVLSENQVPVIIMDRSGQRKAYVLPYEEKIPFRYRDQKFILRNERSEERYRKWAETKRMIIGISALKRIGKDKLTRCEEIGEGNYSIIMKELISSMGIEEEKYMIVKNTVCSLFHGIIAKKLLRAGFDIHLGVINRRKNFGLILDVSYIMDGEIDLQTLQFFKTDAKREIAFHHVFGRCELKPNVMRFIAHRFENRKKTIGQMVDNIIDELCTLMREIKM
ncbi:MAG: CRISPR-associated endonuclease Cas1 [Deltaproteobacteria bacterium]|nr:CRISPR-associated endonuclease Cas1 [Deltaproteobacteria bacterium]